ncbi:MAG: phosphatidylglycerol lysyltransferase domain-containing protein [Prolixibacteraceae bacterium]
MMVIRYLKEKLPPFITRQATPFIRENKKIIVQFIFTLFFIAIGVWFIEHERTELSEVKSVLKTANWIWITSGILLSAVYILLQGQMYVYSFASVRIKISLFDATILFLKRNLISIFLPAGGISSLAFFTKTIEKKGIQKSQIHFASSVYGFIGILSVIIVAVPAFIYALVEGTIGSGEWYALAAVILLKLILIFMYRSILKKGYFYQFMVKLMPETEVFMADLQNNRIDQTQFIFTVATSVAIEFTGIAHLYMAILALGFQASVIAVIMGYIISVIFLIVSPFLRGLGAIEVSMSYVLIRFGFGNIEAIAATFLYRFFEFWLPLLAGIFAFISKVNKLLMRVLPAIFLLGLGILNIISVLTPAISERVNNLREFLPIEVINTSNGLVFIAGLFLLVTAAFMLKGLKSAWWFAILLSVLSLIGHITKAIDYEEASIALMVLAVLIATRREYYIKNNPRLRNVGLQSSLLLAFVTLIYGIAGFYYLDKVDLKADFNLIQSIQLTIQNYLFIGNPDLPHASIFARNFIFSLHVSGFISLVFLIYTLVYSYSPTPVCSSEELELAGMLVLKYGCSALDYFKTYSDKMLFFPENKTAFIAYRISGNFAVALENPVAENQKEMKRCIREFDKYCYQNGLKSIFYRVPEESLELFQQLKKKSLFLGQEGVVNLDTFDLKGGSKKSMRNAINKVIDQGYKITVHVPPVKDGVLQKIKSVSDEWLLDTHRSEIVFSQGMFVWEELKQQTILTVENPEEKVIAFLNVIPDFVSGEATYDLIRKTKDAPNGVMDFILTELFKYLKTEAFHTVNLGFAPLSGINDAHTFPEKSMKFAYEKIRTFAQYKGLREYKEKFEPQWTNKYLIYQEDYDLVKVPKILSDVIKP